MTSTPQVTIPLVIQSVVLVQSFENATAMVGNMWQTTHRNTAHQNGFSLNKETKEVIRKVKYFVFTSPTPQFEICFTFFFSFTHTQNNSHNFCIISP